MLDYSGLGLRLRSIGMRKRRMLRLPARAVSVRRMPGPLPSSQGRFSVAVMRQGIPVIGRMLLRAFARHPPIWDSAHRTPPHRASCYPKLKSFVFNIVAEFTEMRALTFVNHLGSAVKIVDRQRQKALN